MVQKKIMIVDDELHILTLLEKRLTHAGYSVMSESDPMKVLDRVKSDAPALVVLDIMMPDKDGIELAADLRRDEATRGIPILFLSALKNQKDIKQIEQYEGIGVISKPFESSSLLTAINSLLGAVKHGGL